MLNTIVRLVVRGNRPVPLPVESETQPQPQPVEYLRPNARNRPKAKIYTGLLDLFYGGDMPFETRANYLIMKAKERIRRLEHIDAQSAAPIKSTLGDFESVFGEASDSEEILKSYTELEDKLSAYLDSSRRFMLFMRTVRQPESKLTRQIKKYIDVKASGSEILESFLKLGDMIDRLRLAHEDQVTDLNSAWIDFSNAFRQHELPETIMANLTALKEQAVKTTVREQGDANQIDEVKNLIDSLKDQFQNKNGMDWLKRLKRVNQQLVPVLNLVKAEHKLPHHHRESAFLIKKHEDLMKVLYTPDSHYSSAKVREAAREYLKALDSMEKRTVTWMGWKGKLPGGHGVFKPKETLPLRKALAPFLHEGIDAGPEIDKLWYEIPDVHRMPDETRQAKDALIHLMKTDDIDVLDDRNLSPAAWKLLKSLDKALQTKKKHAFASHHLEPLRTHVMGYLAGKHQWAYELQSEWRKIVNIRKMPKDVQITFNNLIANLTLSPHSAQSSGEQNYVDLDPARLNILVRQAVSKVKTGGKYVFSDENFTTFLEVLNRGLPRSSESTKRMVIPRLEGVLRKIALNDRFGQPRNGDIQTSTRRPGPSTGEFAGLNIHACDNETIIGFMNTSYQLLMDGFVTLAEDLSAKGIPLDKALSSKTRHTWFDLLCKVHHSDDSEIISQSIREFAEYFKEDWKKMRYTPDSRCGLHRYAENLATAGNRFTNQFNRWLGMQHITPMKNIDEAFEKALDFEQYEAPKGGPTRNVSPHPLSRVLQFAFIDTAVWALQSRAAKDGGFHFGSSKSTLGAVLMPNFGIAFYHLFTTILLLRSRFKKHRVRSEGEAIEQSASHQLSHLADTNETTSLTGRTEQEIKLALGQTLKEAGSPSLLQDVVLAADVFRRLSVSGMAISNVIFLFTPLAPITPAFYGAGAVLAILGALSSFNDHYCAHLGSVDIDRHESLIANRITQLVHQMDEGDLKLDNAVQQILRSAHRDKNLIRRLAISELLFGTAFLFEAGNALAAVQSSPAMQQAAATASGLTGSSIAGIVTNSIFGVYSVVASIGVAKHTFESAMAVGSKKEAIRAYRAYLDHTRGNKNAFNLYKDGFAKKLIGHAAEDLGAGIKKMPETARIQFAQIASNLKVSKREASREKSQSSPDMAAVQTSATTIAENIKGLRPLVADSFKNILQENPALSPLDDSDKELIRVHLEAIGEPETIPSATTDDSASSGVNPLSVHVFSASTPVLDRAIKHIETSLLSKDRKVPARIHRKVSKALERARLSMGEGSLMDAAAQVVSIYDNRVQGIFISVDRSFKNLIKSIDHHLRFVTKMDLYEDEIKKLLMPVRNNETESDGLHALAVTNVRNDLLREYPMAYPALIQYMMQNPNWRELEFGWNLLSDLGLEKRALVNLSRMGLEEHALDYLAQVTKSPPALNPAPSLKKVINSSPVKNPIISTPRELAVEYAQRRLAQDQRDLVILPTMLA